MRIAQVAPLAESCPPRLYGGTERVVSYLTEELAARGHEVTLFAAGDSRTGAHLIPAVPTALRLVGRNHNPYPYMMIQLAQVARAAAAEHFDVVHFHWDYLHLPLFHLGEWPPVVTTLHGRLDLPFFPDLVAAFPTMPLVSISDAQRRPVPEANWARTVRHGLPQDLIRPGSGAGGYLAFLGRISPEKRVDRAVEIARRVGLPLRIAAKVDPADQEYFEREIRHLLGLPGVSYVGEVDDAGKAEFLRQAAALLFPIDWPEPFGLVMIEAMAAGTPVIAFAHGSVGEVIENGRTGYAVSSLDEGVAATRAALGLDRRRVRAAFESRFSVRRMADDYLDLYRDLILECQRARAPGKNWVPHVRAGSGGVQL
jgi:glycosyltransferase involved in cell wall biosynthesis